MDTNLSNEPIASFFKVLHPTVIKSTVT